jgi:hypothetical protein
MVILVRVHPSVKRAISSERHYLKTIATNKTGSGRHNIQICGTTGDIESRINNCRTTNGVWSFYSGAQYGQIGEGDWSLVSVVSDGSNKYEVWRDERTKLLWSDRTSQKYNWYQASGYSKPQDISYEETEHRSDPGSGRLWDGTNTVMQPSSPISVCPDVVDGEIAAGGGHYTNYDPNPETAFKGNLRYSDNLIWKLPSLDDWRLADINGIRKVLPNMDDTYLSSLTYSINRGMVWLYKGGLGDIDQGFRRITYSVRCVAFVRD